MDFLQAFQHAYGGGGTVPATMREILDASRRWLEGEGNPETLLEGVETMAGKAARNLASTEDDLRKNPRLDAELREAMALSVERFGDLHAGLRELASLVRAGTSEPVPELLELLEETALDLGHLSRAMKAWLDAPGPCCPRCGSRGAEDRCPDCGLDRLTPDPVHLQDRSLRTAVLPPAFAGVFRAYTGVLNGRKALGELFAALSDFEGEMLNTRGRAEVLVRQGAGPAAADLAASVRAALEGVEQMRRVAETRAMRDLHQGWGRLFVVGQRFHETTADVLHEGGRSEQAGELLDSRRFTDVVQLEGD